MVQTLRASGLRDLGFRGVAWLCRFRVGGTNVLILHANLLKIMKAFGTLSKFVSRRGIQGECEQDKVDEPSFDYCSCLYHSHRILLYQVLLGSRV